MAQSRLVSATAMAVALTCWPAPVSAMSRVLHALGQQRLRALVPLWAPPWTRFSRLRTVRTMRAPSPDGRLRHS
ncbi:hypothetical protein HMPREF9062_1486 [Actinomyces sp. oral taxon 448 str. F0400]|nr:hypothetical protein HMPREF9062_1486 [Actinomyces sp. oral taxon 448 str. F0400]